MILPEASLNRHYGLDWLRIGAFGLLIFYHVGMFFVPWGWHVKTAVPVEWVSLPMLALNPWRLTLLFVVSGFATRSLLVSRGKRGFAVDRSLRLMVPVVVAAIVVIPPQPWVELMVKHGYTKSFLEFWSTDYFRFGVLEGQVLPTWQHLWFVVYLWVYTLLVALGIRVGDRWSLQARFDALFRGWRLLAIPTAWLVLVRVGLARGVEETHNLFVDPSAHLRYLPAFLFGFGLAGTQSLWDAIDTLWRRAAYLALFSYLPTVGIEIVWPGNAVPPAPVLDVLRVARAIQGWATIIALLGIANRFRSSDHPWRATLTEAVFPAYVIHQTIIVVLGWSLLPYRLPRVAEFVLLVAATVVGSIAFYVFGRSIGWLRPLIGLRPRGTVASFDGSGASPRG